MEKYRTRIPKKIDAFFIFPVKREKKRKKKVDR